MKNLLKLTATCIVVYLLTCLNLKAQGNYFAGSGAGASNTSGTQNTFVGYVSGNKNTSGKYNSFFGSHTGYFNSTGSENSFFGFTTGLHNTTGKFNTFLGTKSGSSNTTGSSNTFVGWGSGFGNKSGTSNTFIGSSAGSKNTASDNTFVGSDAGYHNTTGYSNLLVGRFSGYNNTTGKFNTFIGSVSGLKNTTGSRNTFLGEGTGGAIKTGSDNVFIGFRAQNKWNDSNGSVALGSYATVQGTINAAAIGYRAHVSVSNAIVLGSISGVNGATANTNVGIGITAPAYRLHVNGDAAKPGSSSWTVASDKRLKKDIKAFEDGIEVLRQIKPVRYKYNGKAGMPTENEYIGVIAQEVEEVAPYMIHRFEYEEEGTKEEYLDFDATALPFIIINAIKGQQEALEAKDEQLQQLLEEVKALKEEVESLKNPSKKEKQEEALKQGYASDPDQNLNYAKLWQNVPNPFSQTTSIQYEIQSNFRQANILVLSKIGDEIERIDLVNPQGEVELNFGTEDNGIYFYQLWVDGQLMDSKKMIFSR